MTVAPVVHYPFDDTVTTDASGNGNTGIFAGTGTTLVTGQIGGALSFNGSGWVTFTSVASLGLATATTEFSCACWIKTSQLDCTILSLRNTSISNVLLDFVLGNNGVGNSGTGKLSLSIRGDSGSVRTLTSTGSAINDNAWHHVAITRTSAKLNTLYVDGISVGTQTDLLTVGLTPNVAGSAIGYEVVAAARRLTGSLDDFRIYDRALTSTEVAALYSAGTSTTLTAAAGSYALTGTAATFVTPFKLTAAAGSYTLTGSTATVTGTYVPNQWLTFQNQNAIDFGTNNVDGTLSGSPTFDTGVSPPAIVLNGTTQYVSGTNHPVNSQTTNVTLCCWVYITGSLAGIFLHVGSPAASSGNGDGYGIGIGSTTFGLAGNNLVGIVDGVASLPFATVIGTGWHHIGLTRDATTWRGYIDGVVCGPTFTSNPSGTSAGWAIGRFTNNAPRLFAGKIQDARFYAQRLSTDELSALYAAGPQAASSGDIILTAAASSYTLTGTAAKFAYKQPAAAGSYALTGTAATLAYSANVTFPAAAGAYTITGSVAAFQIGSNVVLATDPGVYAQTGTAAAFAYKQSVGTGSYSLTGSDAEFDIDVNFVFPAAAGSFTLIGNPMVENFVMPLGAAGE